MAYEKKFLKFFDSTVVDALKNSKNLPGEFEQKKLRKMCELIGCDITESARSGSHTLICFHTKLKELGSREYMNGVFDIPLSHSKGSKNKPMVDKSVLKRVCKAIYLIKERIDQDDAE